MCFCAKLKSILSFQFIGNEKQYDLATDAAWKRLRQ